MAQYQLARVELVKKYLSAGAYTEALSLIEEYFVYPHNLGKGKLCGAQENDFHFYKAVVLRALGRVEEAGQLFRKAATDNNQPAAAIFYNDQKPDKIFYQRLALRALGDDAQARGRFNNLSPCGDKSTNEY